MTDADTTASEKEIGFRGSLLGGRSTKLLAETIVQVIAGKTAMYYCSDNESGRKKIEEFIKEYVPEEVAQRIKIVERDDGLFISKTPSP